MKLLLLAFFVAATVASPLPMEEEPSDAVEVVVNGLAEGEALEIGHIVDVKVHDVVDGEVVAVANALHPFTAQGLAEAAAIAAEAEAAEAELAPVPEVNPVLPAPEIVTPELVVPEVPQPIVLPEPGSPVVVPEPVVLPEPATPDVVPQPIVQPEPETPVVAPEPVVLPEPASPVVVPEPIVLPEPGTPVVVPAPVDLPDPGANEIILGPGAEPVTPESIPEPTPNGEIFNNGLVSITVNTPEEAGVIATLSSWVSMMVNYVHSGIAYTQQLI